MKSHAAPLTVVMAGLAGSIQWHQATWCLGIPPSSSYDLIGGVVGTAMAAAGSSAVKTEGLVAEVIGSTVLSPVWHGRGQALHASGRVVQRSARPLRCGAGRSPRCRRWEEPDRATMPV
ncbi:inorganic phosphate transporter [Streptomyces sp. C10-9-1]|uniref:inorganic phosphate transporter n=1 Tax=Streptomyces sp. C10-9-1 TaxID=1859285 RepID=UPI003F49ED1F